MFKRFKKRDGGDASQMARITQTGTRITFVNKAAKRLLGVTKNGQIIGRSLLDFANPISKEEIRKNIDSMLLEKKSRAFTPMKLMTVDGHEIAVTLIIEPSGNENSPPENLELSFKKMHDGSDSVDLISESREAGIPEQSFDYESEAKFQAIADKSLVGIYLIQDYLFRYVNPKFAEIFGYKIDEIVDKLGPRDLVHSADWPFVREQIRRRLDGELETANFEFRGLTRYGKIVWIEVYGSKLQIDGKAAVMGTLLDNSRKHEYTAVQNMIYNINNTAHEKSSLESLLEFVSQQLQDYFEVSNFYIALYIPETGEFEYPYYSEKGRQYFPSFLSLLNHDLPEYVCRDGKPLLVDNRELERIGLGNSDRYFPSDAMLWMGTPLWNAGEIIGVAAILSDSDRGGNAEKDLEIFSLVANQITQAIVSKKTEGLLRANEEKLSIMLHDLPGMVYRSKNDKNWTMIYVSEGSLELTGYAPEFLINNCQIAYENIIHPADRAMVRDEVENAITEARPFQIEYRIITSKAEEKWVWEKGRVVAFEQGTATILEGFIADITELKRTEERLSKSENLVTAALEYLPAGVIIADAPDANISFANTAALNIRGKTKLPLIKIHAALHPSRWQMYHRDGSILFPEESPLSRAISFGESTRDTELIIKRDNGEERWISISATPVLNADGQVIAAVAVFPDITEHKEMEKSLLAANEKLKRDQRLMNEKNIALREILSQLDAEKKAIEGQIQNNISKVILPAVEALKNGSRAVNAVQIQHLIQALEEITSPFVGHLQKKFFKLTPREVEICNLIRRGLTSKEISGMLNIAIETVNQQRKLIRRKLGLTNRDINLTSYLNSI